MAVRAGIGDLLVQGEEKGIHLFILFAHGQGLVKIALAGAVLGNNFRDDGPFVASENLEWTILLEFGKEMADLDVKKMSDSR